MSSIGSLLFSLQEKINIRTINNDAGVKVLMRLLCLFFITWKISIVNQRKKNIFWFWVDIIAKLILFVAIIIALKLVFFK